MLLNFVLGIAELLLGVVLIWVGNVSYPQTRGKIQDSLDALWIQLDEKTKPIYLNLRLFTTKVARNAVKSLNALFGRKWISLRLVCTSTCFSVASLIFFSDRVFSTLPPTLADSRVLNDTLILAFLLLGSIPIAGLNRLGRAAWYLTVLGALFLWEGYRVTFSYNTPFSTAANYALRLLHDLAEGRLRDVWLNPRVGRSPQLLGSVIFLGLISDILTLAISKWALAKAVQAKGWPTVMSSMGLSLAIPFLLVVFPFWWFFTFFARHRTSVWPFTSHLQLTFFKGMWALCASNLFDLVIILVPFLVSLFLILNELMRRHVPQAVYALRDEKTILHWRKLSAVLGLSLFARGCPTLLQSLWDLERLILRLFH